MLEAQWKAMQATVLMLLPILVLSSSDEDAAMEATKGEKQASDTNRAVNLCPLKTLFLFMVIQQTIVLKGRHLFGEDSLACA